MRKVFIALLMVVLLSVPVLASNLNDQLVEKRKYGWSQEDQWNLFDLCAVEEVATIAVGAEADNVIKCVVSVKDTDGNAISGNTVCTYWLADADKVRLAAGDPSAATATAPDVSLVRNGSYLVKELTSNICGIVALTSSGNFSVNVNDDDADNDWYLCVATNSGIGTSLTISHAA